MKNKISVLVLLAAVMIPQVVFASWWNPFSWIKSKETYTAPKTQDIETKISELESKLDKVTENNNLNIKENIKKEIEVPTVITKTIQVDNPELQTKINALLKENIDLQTKVGSLSSSYNNLVQQLNTCKANLADVKSVSVDSDISNTITEQKKISIGSPICGNGPYSSITIPITFTGISGKYAVVEVISDSTHVPKMNNLDPNGLKYVTIPNVSGNYTFKITTSTESPSSPVYKADSTLTNYSETISITRCP
ncbi:MAG: hypothetical protein A2431_00615 [Candidatus Zambryskibacteria bacterium RIFOXYC1_FULL_39_10]|uniref:Uncharacterized protein n=1 Tax=Candidatus Zambryskibacteria bacterium RIFOXYC1_FULL_39_10 TaxID=1802779 RepID=A0A1G2UZ99_9BACT|nr:MAG: hypothetical protein A2431_00615 [Candidatus Zambryskibacteria bacterium RIFOXYC1_FULL_39_10]OHB15646.1 MAG: hypothetical protein A2605_02475 [Candidatus Zambryskibacteria bacterium RIFOXYD1_FULL_39_35]